MRKAISCNIFFHQILAIYLEKKSIWHDSRNLKILWEYESIWGYQVIGRPLGLVFPGNIAVLTHTMGLVEKWTPMNNHSTTCAS